MDTREMGECDECDESDKCDKCGEWNYLSVQFFLVCSDSF
jgi:hypothetical protein